eukprot:TRINITY_DN3566_c0_g1_i2.p1 TRINITY_DN3566_c0_g1~~TRINITY_DN3566_c0_g1_i2.p1  ORF type:complete len:278 (-),score=44.02 TRINITY_DN3566_c0_g1_i2:302-1084(-)
MNQKVPIVFIHGMKGGSLVNELGTIVWVRATQAFWRDMGPDESLELPLQWENGVQKRDGLKPGHVISKVSGILKVYLPWLDVAKSLGRPFYEFAYDWRRDLFETSALFEEFLKGIVEKEKSAVQVVAHSMGGLITFVTLNRNPQLFHSCLFAGTPFLSGISYLQDIHQGAKIGRNVSLLSVKTQFTFTSAYFLLPFKDNHKIYDVHNNPIDIDFFSVEDWINHKIGIFYNHDMTDEIRDHLENCLARAKHFRSLISTILK